MTGEALTEAIRIFLENRSEFYRTQLSRIPEPKFREYLRTAIECHLEDTAEPPTDLKIGDAENALLQGLVLRDLLKKSGYGRILARTTISFEEALRRAQDVEETGLLFFDALVGLMKTDAFLQQQAENHRLCLSKLLELDDAVRYRKIAMPPAP